MTIKFGWCIDLMHDRCKHSFTWHDKVITCECPCHGTEHGKDIGSAEVAQEGPKGRAARRKK
jgi:hypothetical protein